MTAEIYPNQQLRAVTLQTQFPGRIAALTLLHQAQDALSADFPKLYVPHAGQGEAIALKPYQFRSADENEMVSVAVNVIAYTVRRYPGSRAFLEKGVPLLQRVHEILGIQSLNRVVYRYENEIGIDKVDGVLAIDRVLDQARLKLLRLSALRSIDLEWVEVVDGGELQTKLLVEDAGWRDVLHLHLSAATVPGGTVPDLLRAASGAHGIASARFEMMISEDFRQALSGPTDPA